MCRLCLTLSVQLKLLGDGVQALDLNIGLKVFMDARSTVTAKEGDRYPLRPPIMKKYWTLWAKALGEKAGDDSQADKVAIIRTIIVVSYLVTNCFIVAGVIKHW